MSHVPGSCVISPESVLGWYSIVCVSLPRHEAAKLTHEATALISLKKNAPFQTLTDLYNTRILLHVILLMEALAAARRSLVPH